MKNARWSSYKIYLAISMVIVVHGFISLLHHALGFGYGAYLLVDCEATPGDIIVVL